MALSFKDFGTIHGVTKAGRARKIQSDMIMKESWWQDIQAQTAYLYDMFHDIGDDHFKLNDLHPEYDRDKTPIDVKFIRHTSQTYNKDPVTYWLQLQPNQECNVDYYDEMYSSKYNNFFPVGLYCDIMDESGKYNKWLVVNTANYNQNQFPTFELLRCDYLFQWIHDGHRFECPGVLQSQNSYNSGLWTDYKTTSVQDQQKFAVPLNSITETLFYNHRMIIDSNLYNVDSEPRAWLISKVNRISPDGIVRVTLAQDLFDQHKDYMERDSDGNIIGKWADYFVSNIEPQSVSLEENNTYLTFTGTITCSGKPQLKVGGSAKTFTTTYTSPYGNVDEMITDGWSFYIDGEPVPLALLSLTPNTEENKIKVKFLGDDSYIGKILTVKSVSNEIEASLDVEIIAL